MKRLVLAVAVLGLMACKQGENAAQRTADSTAAAAAMSDSMHMMGDSLKMMGDSMKAMADSAKKGH